MGVERYVDWVQQWGKFSSSSICRILPPSQAKSAFTDPYRLSPVISMAQICVDPLGWQGAFPRKREPKGGLQRQEVIGIQWMQFGVVASPYKELQWIGQKIIVEGIKNPSLHNNYFNVCMFHFNYQKIFLPSFLGYQRQLLYKHHDGSYSAFGSRDKEGNIW